MYVNRFLTLFDNCHCQKLFLTWQFKPVKNRVKNYWCQKPNNSGRCDSLQTFRDRKIDLTTFASKDGTTQNTEWKRNQYEIDWTTAATVSFILQQLQWWLLKQQLLCSWRFPSSNIRWWRWEWARAWSPTRTHVHDARCYRKFTHKQWDTIEFGRRYLSPTKLELLQVVATVTTHSYSLGPVREIIQTTKLANVQCAV